MDDADPVGDSSGVLATELAVVEGVDSAVMLRLKPARRGRAVVLIVAVEGRCGGGGSEE